MKGYKGFNKDLTCRCFQYEVGKEYTEEKAELCNSGFHACENPLDCFGYYPPASSVYHEVELNDVSKKKDDDTKRVGKRIKVGAEIGIKGVVEAGVKFIMEKCEFDGDSVTTGDQAGAQATGYRAGAQATGYQAGAQATGYQAGAQATGDQAGAQATGDRAGAQATGYRAGAQATGCNAVANAVGYESTAFADGNNAVAIASGKNCKAKGTKGAVLFLVERSNDFDEKFGYKIVGYASVRVGEHGIKENTWYQLVGGKVVEAK